MKNAKRTNYWNESVKYTSKCIAQSFMKTSKKFKNKRSAIVACGCGDPGCKSCEPCRVSTCGCS